MAGFGYQPPRGHLKQNLTETDIFLGHRSTSIKSFNDANLLLFWRCSVGVLLVIAFHYGLIASGIMLKHFSPYHVFNTLISLQETLNMIGIWMAVALLAAFICYDVKWEKPVRKQPKILGAFIYAASSFLLTFSYMKLLDNYLHFGSKESSNSKLFVLQSSPLVGISYFYKLERSSGNIVKISSKYFDSWANLFGKVLAHATDVLCQVSTSFFILYFLIYRLLDIHEEDLVGIVSLRTFYIGFFIHWLVLTGCKATLLLLHLKITERIYFPIDFEGTTECITLSKAMSSDNMFLKYSAFYDFSAFTLNDNSRIESLFKLSYPGGFPSNWRGVFQNCQMQIGDFRTRLQEYLKNVQNDLKPKEEDSKANKGASPKEPEQPLSFASASQLYSKRGRMRNLAEQVQPSSFAYNQDVRQVMSPNNVILEVQRINRREERGSRWKFIKSTWSDFLDYFNIFDMIQDLIEFIFSGLGSFIKGNLKKIENKIVKNGVTRSKRLEAQREKVHRIFCDIDLVAFAVHGLADICCVSFYVDKRGIIQLDLKDILQCILGLMKDLETFEKEFKKAFNCSDEDIEAGSLKESFKSGKNLKYSCQINIRRLDALFGPYFSEMDIPRDFLKKL